MKSILRSLVAAAGLVAAVGVLPAKASPSDHVFERGGIVGVQQGRPTTAPARTAIENIAGRSRRDGVDHGANDLCRGQLTAQIAWRHCYPA